MNHTTHYHLQDEDPDHVHISCHTVQVCIGREHHVLRIGDVTIFATKKQLTEIAAVILVWKGFVAVTPDGDIPF